MEITTTRFGKIHIEDDRILNFVHEILGFPESRRFVLLPHKEASPLYWLQSLDQPDLAFVVVRPETFLSDYSFDLPEDIQSELKIERAEDAVVLVLLTIERRNDSTNVTANLLGPVVINERHRLASQVVLNPNKYPVQFPVTSSTGRSSRKRQGGQVQKAAGA